MFNFTKSRCYNGGSRHKFSPRYSENVYKGDIKFEKRPSAQALRELMYYNTYVTDVCEWCGKVVKSK